jgi:leucyl aminopeptidase (aminopeptidase T)
MEEQDLKLRYELAAQRIRQIPSEERQDAPYGEYFHKTASFLGQMLDVYQKISDGSFDRLSLEEHRALNRAVYADILPEQYAESYANPDYAVEKLGDEFGPILSMIYTELRGIIPAVYECNEFEITILLELFLMIYSEFAEQPTHHEVYEDIYYFFHDYSDYFMEKSVRGLVDPSLTFAKDIIMDSDLTDLRYLYRYGEYISQTEEQMAAFLLKLSDEEIQKMADTYTEGYRIGFEVAGIDLSKKKVANIRFSVGFERVIRAAIRNFKKLNLDVTIYRSPVSAYCGRTHTKNGYFSISPNKQYDYDHRADMALYMDKALIGHKLNTRRSAFEKYADLARVHAGPAVSEIFGEVPFVPVTKKTAPDFSKKQQEMRIYYSNMAGAMQNEFIPGDERSFTIITYPVPTIGKEFEAIFRETVKLNTLDYMKYRNIQQTMIDALDKGRYVHVKGSGVNRTDLRIMLQPITDPKKETGFENCVADVNIPVGEVFTSPLLHQTDGILHVSKVYLFELEYIDLEFRFKDGIIVDYNCKNFEDEAENKKYILENILHHHETLPMGEFAIGTNTTAYRMARDYNIADKLPILIAEKTGPHFAVGDTCYSRQEEMDTFNPDGKRIIAKENDFSRLRDEDVSKAYFNCHTDITIPYDELGVIEVIDAEGQAVSIIEDGRFVLAGTEELNEPLKR